MRNYTFLIKKNRWSHWASSAVAAICVLGIAVPVYAQQEEVELPHMDTSFNLQLFKPAPGPLNFFNIESPELGDDMTPSVGAMLFYGLRPFAIYNCNADNECSDDESARDANGDRLKTIHAVKNLLTLDILGSFNFLKYFQAGIAIPLTVLQNGQYANVEMDNAADIAWLEPGPDYTTVFAPGDIRIHVKGRFFGDDRKDGISLAVSANMTIPLWDLIGYGREEEGDDDYDYTKGVYGYGGDGFISGTAPRLLFGFRHGNIRTAVNFGLYWRKKAELLNIEIGHQLEYGGAFGYTVIPQVELIAELYGTKSIVGSFTDTESGSLLFLAGGRFPIKNATLYTAFGGGILSGVGVPQFQFVVGGAWTPIKVEKPSESDLLASTTDLDTDGIENSLDKCPTNPEDIDNYQDEDGCPDLDNDGDGIADGYDSCVNEPEDKDNFMDDDGCPDLDHDEDNIKEPQDKCPQEAEDFDEFEDADGCPEPDNDKDGLLDPDDFCPVDAEDKDGFEDEDGCPDLDNDRDGVPDGKDKCPEEPETLNSYKDDDGCPDKGDALVVVTAEKIELKEMIQFKTDSDEIRGTRSFEILAIITNILNANSTIKLTIEGHTDNAGSADHNRELSKRRADAVKKYLVDHGISADRLETAGYGPDRPIGDNRRTAGRTANRRVEFIIIQDENAAPPAAAAAPAGAPAKKKSEEKSGGGDMDFTGGE